MNVSAHWIIYKQNTNIKRNCVLHIYMYICVYIQIVDKRAQNFNSNKFNQKYDSVLLGPTSEEHIKASLI